MACAFPFRLEPLETRLLLSSAGPSPIETPPAAPAIALEAVILPTQDEAGQGEVSIFGEFQNLKALQAEAVDPARLECLQPLEDGSFAYFIRMEVFAGDVTTIDLSGRNLEGIGIEQPFNDYGKIAELPDWIKTLAESGRALFVPRLPAPALETELTFNARTDGNVEDCNGMPVLAGSPVQVRVIIELKDGYSMAGGNAVTYGTTQEDYFRQQQRLAYLGFPGEQGNPLVVDGKTGANTRWAIQLFNAAVIDRNLATAPATPISDFINARNAPRWVEFMAATGLRINPNSDGTTQSERWGTSWAREVVEAALARYRDGNSGTLPFQGASLLQGGPTVHQSHQAGMDVDFDIPSVTNAAGTPWYVTRSANGTSYVAANTGANHIVWQLEDGSYTGAGPPTASGGRPAGVPAGSTPLAHTYGGVYNNQSVLRGIYNADLFVLAENYDRADAIAQINAFSEVDGVIVSTRSGATTRNIYYNDPGAWGLAPADPLPPEGDPNTAVVFEDDHAGHFHVNIKPPARVFDQLSASEADSILQGLNGLGDFIRRLVVYQPDSLRALATSTSISLNTTLPLAGRSLGELLGLSDIWMSRFTNPLRNYFATDQTPSATEIEAALGQLSFSGNGVTLRVAPEMDLVQVAGKDEFRFNVDLELSVESAVSLTLPAIASSLGISLGDTRVNISAAMEIEFTFGLSLGGSAPLTEAFFTEITRLDAAAGMNASNVATAGQIAGLSVALSQGRISLMAGVDITTKAGRLSTSELRNKPLRDLIRFNNPALSGETLFTVRGSPLEIGGASITLGGMLSANERDVDFALAASVSNWQPAPFITVDTLNVTLSKAGLEFAAVADIAGANDVVLKGDYQISTRTYALAASAPINWTLLPDVDLTNIRFTMSNRDADGSAGATRVSASGSLNLFGTDFAVQGHVTAGGAWIAATPLDPLILVPGLHLEGAYLIATNYTLVLDAAGNEISQSQNNSRTFAPGVNLAATAELPGNIPAVGGSVVEISGLLGTSLSQMALEAKLTLDRPAEIAGLLALDSVGLRITGGLTITVFGDGRVLHERIPGLDQDLAVRAGLTLDIIHTTLEGSLSLLRPVNNVFGVQGFNLIEGDGSFGINFATAPLPLPTFGFNLLVELPAFAQDLLALPPRARAAWNVSTTEPITAISVEDWQPLAKLGLNNLEIREGMVVIAPNGGTIGQRIFPRGFSAAFAADLFGTNVNFQGRFDEQTQGIALSGYVSTFTVAGVKVTGIGPDGQWQDGRATGGTNDVDNDNGVSFNANLTPQKQDLGFTGRVILPGKTDDGRDAFLELTGKMDPQGLELTGRIQNWNVAPKALKVNTAEFSADVPFANAAGGSLEFFGDLTLLQAPIQIAGSISQNGVMFAGTLRSPGTFAGLAAGDFTLSFSSVPGNQHAVVQFTVDLPGTGGVTIVGGAFQNGTLVLDASISQWQPLPALLLNGTLHASLPLTRSTLNLEFDVTGSILGSSARFKGTLSSSPNGFTLFATSTIALRLPGGLRLADLEATIDLGHASPFSIGLAGEFQLPGTRPATASLQGSIGAGGIVLFGTIDDWVLVPGLAFDGLVKFRFRAGVTPFAIIPIGVGRIPVVVDPTIPTDPLPANTENLSIQIDISTSLLGSNLRLAGKLIADRSGNFDFDVRGHVRLTGPLVAGVLLDLDASVMTRLDGATRTYRLTFSGDLQIFNGFNAVHISATMQGDSGGNWLLRVEGGVEFDASATIDGIISLSINVSINGTLTLRSNRDFSFGLAVNGSARARVPSLGFDESVRLDVGIDIDLAAGTATIPNARPRVEYNRLGIATGIDWRNYVLSTPAPDAPAPTVTATLVGSRLPDRPSTVEIRGTDAPEKITVSLQGRLFAETLVVQGATGASALTTLLSVPVGSVDAIDIDMKGGNDNIDVAIDTRFFAGTEPRVIIRGGLGSDTITTSGASASIYGNRDNATDDAIDGGDEIASGGRADLVYGGGGDDHIATSGNNAIVDGGSGTNIINGTLLIKGTEGADRITVERTTNRRFFFGRPFADASAGTILVRYVTEGGPEIVLAQVPVESLRSVEVRSLGGDDTISIAANVAFPTLLDGGAGTDTIRAGGGPAIVEADSMDQIFNGSGAMTIRGGNTTITGAAFQRSGGQVRSMVLPWNRDVSATLSAEDVEIISASGEKLTGFALAWSAETNRATLTFVSVPADGAYTLRIARAAVTDVSGNTLASDFNARFISLAADVTGDGRVNSLDLLAVIRELSKTAALRSLTYDANADGKVDTADVAYIRQRFGRSVT